MARKKKAADDAAAAPVAAEFPVIASSEELQRRDAEGRQAIRNELDVNLLVEAGAGSGKTTEMVNRMVGLVSSGRCTIEQMAAVTFTRKAAAELRDRFELRLREVFSTTAPGPERDRLESAIRNLSHASIGTVHSFCGSLLRERPIEAGVDLNFRELDEFEANALRQECWVEFCNNFNQTDPELFEQVLQLRLVLDNLKTGFFDFVENADVEDWPTDELEWGSLVVFLRQEGYANRIQDFLNRIIALIPLFPASDARGSDRFMEQYEDFVNSCAGFNLTDVYELIECLQKFTPPKTRTKGKWPGGKEESDKEVEYYEKFLDEVVKPALRAVYSTRYRVIINLYKSALKKYQELKASLRVLDFQDLLVIAARMLRHSPEVREYFQKRHALLLVDEFQDTDPLQAEVMFLLTSTDPEEKDWLKCEPRPGALFVVGDPKQSIYRFKRGDIETYQAVKERIGKCVVLPGNHRTEKELIEWINQHFSKRFSPTPSKESPVFEPMLSLRTNAGKVRTGPGTIHRMEFGVKSEELVEADSSFVSRHIAKMISSKATMPRKQDELSSGLPEHVVPRDFMVILQGKGNLVRFASKLVELGLPVDVTGGLAFSGNRELGLLLELLTVLCEPDNPIALVALLRGELYGISDDQLYNFRKSGGYFNFFANQLKSDGSSDPIWKAFEQLREFSSDLRTLPPAVALGRIVAKSGLLASALSSPSPTAGPALALAFEKLRTGRGDYGSSPPLVAELEHLLNGRVEASCQPLRAETDSSIRLINLHKAKGLEAPVIFLSDATGRHSHEVKLIIDRSGARPKGYLAVKVEWGEFHKKEFAQPLCWPTKVEQEERFLEAEKVRLQYVAATRAGVQLVVSHRKSHGDKNHWRELAESISDSLPDPGPQQPFALANSIKLSEKSVSDSLKQIPARRDRLLMPGYDLATAKEFNKGKSKEMRKVEVEVDFKGPEWGTLVHRLLELRAIDPNCDLMNVAISVTEEVGLVLDAAKEACETVEAIMKSAFWKRVQAASERLIEVPFSISLPGPEVASGLPTVVSGVIDLAFREGEQWVIVDHKTDTVEPGGLAELAERYRPQVANYRDFWQRIVGLPVKEAGVFSIRLAEFQAV